MKKIKELFDAEASSPSEISILHNGAVGFRIPEYQREYDWSKKNIDRLFCDCLSGFHRLENNSESGAFTFLGTLILVEEKTKEEDFGGTSVTIVDGQQRLTTLTLLACGLYENLNVAIDTIESSALKPDVQRWITAEINDRLADLLDCVSGTQKIKGNKTYSYPRIIRSKDQRGRSAQTSEYRSPLAKFLAAFANYANVAERDFEPPSLGSGTDAEKLGENYRLIRDLLENLNNPEWYEDSECEQVSIAKINRRGYRSLIDRLADFIKSEDEQNQAIDDLRNCVSVHTSLRTLLFAAYFCRCIVITRVSTEDESAAFDIFDALNTTGEPLTALETLKPRVIKYQISKGGFDGTASDRAFLRIRDHLDELYKNTTQKQRETKELLVSFAMFIDGERLSEHLASQRSFLQTRYEKSAEKSELHAQRFVTSIADMAEFRRYYWACKSVEDLGRFHDHSSLEQVQLLMSVIRDMKTKLALPILARYWCPDIKIRGDNDFLQALKAVTAFLILRRAASGGTAGIDSDLRAIMAPKNGSSRKFGLSAGIHDENEVLSVYELKTAFRKLLADSKFKVSDRNKWVDQVVDNPLYQQAKTVARFMLLAAAHQSVSSSKMPGCWEKKGIKPSPHINNFLNLQTWTGEMYETIEHVAPESESLSGWDRKIYKNTILRHSLGNLVLLPKKENSAIGKASWVQKRVYYSALTEETGEQQQKTIEKARALGMRFSEYTIQLLEQGDRLALLEPLRNVREWDCDLIEARARNTAELTWDYLWPWLS